MPRQLGSLFENNNAKDVCFDQQQQYGVTIATGSISMPNTPYKSMHTFNSSNNTTDSNMKTAYSEENLVSRGQIFTATEVYQMLSKLNTSVNAIRLEIAAKSTTTEGQLQSLARQQETCKEATLKVGEELDVYKSKVDMLTQVVSKLEAKCSQHERRVESLEKTRTS